MAGSIHIIVPFNGEQRAQILARCSRHEQDRLGAVQRFKRSHWRDGLMQEIPRTDGRTIPALTFSDESVSSVQQLASGIVKRVVPVKPRRWLERDTGATLLLLFA